MNNEIFEQRESNIRGYCRAYPTVFDTASNAEQIDEDGKKYIDFFAGAGVLNFGHNNPKMKEALIDYIQNDGLVQSLDTYSTAKRSFLERFTELVLKPRNMNHKFQFNGPTGTNAVEAALKLARRVTGRQQVIAFSHGFHGMTLGALACTANSVFRNAAGVPLSHVRHVSFGCEKLCNGCRENCGMENLQNLRAMLMDSSSGLSAPAAFIVEPIQAEGGVKVASKEWLKAVEQLARDTGALFILDDIQAGCGRTGSYFSFDGMDLDPDIVCLAKGIGGYGTPLAMNLVKPEHDKHWNPGEHTGTFRGQGFSFIAGTVGLDILNEKGFNQATVEKGEKLKAALQAMADRYPEKDFQVRGKGMMQGIDIKDGSLSKAIASECFKQGLLIGPCGAGGRVIKLIPPLTIENDKLETGLKILDQAFDNIISAT